MCTFKKVCVTNRHLTDRSLYEQLKVVFAISKPDVVILREKDLSEDEYRELAYKVKLLCDLYSVRLIVNSTIRLRANSAQPFNYRLMIMNPMLEA